MMFLISFGLVKKAPFQLFFNWRLGFAINLWIVSVALLFHDVDFFVEVWKRKGVKEHHEAEHQTQASILRGLADAQAGRTHDLGSFAHHADDLGLGEGGSGVNTQTEIRP